MPRGPTKPTSVLTEISGLSPDQAELAYDGPAVAASRTFITAGPGGVRLSFIDQRTPNSPLHFRAAVILSFQDAIALADLLQKTVAPFKVAIEQSKAEEEKEEAGDTTQEEKNG